MGVAFNKQKVLDAGRDADDLGSFVNGSETLNGDGQVTTRFGGKMRTLRRLLADIAASPPAEWVARLRGERGYDAPPPLGYMETAAEGQTVFPNPVANADTNVPGNASFATVKRIAGGTGFPYNPESLVIFRDGIKLDLDKHYTAPGGSAPITLKAPATKGQVYAFYTYPIGSSDTGGGTGEAVSIKGFLNPADPDDWEAVRRAATAGARRIYCPKGLGRLPGGKYECGDVPFTNQLKPGRDGSGGPFDYETSRGRLTLLDGVTPMHNVEIYGDGDETIWKVTKNYGLYYNAKSTNRIANLRNLWLHHMAFEGLEGDYVAQTGHVFQISGITGLRINNVTFNGTRGDFLCFQPSPDPDEYSHNYDALIDDCKFNGINKRNRNPITMEDIVGIQVSRSDFFDCVSTDGGEAVGCMDVEPINEKYQHGKVVICNNRAWNHGGAFVAVYVSPPDGYLLPVGGYRIVGNDIEDGQRTFDFAGPDFAHIATATKPCDIEATGNRARRSGDIRVQGIYGASIHHNRFSDGRTYKQGDQGLGRGNREVLFEYNVMTRMGQVDGICHLHDDVSVGCSMSFNTWTECGIQDRTDGAGYLMLARYGPIGTRYEKNIVNDPSGRLKAGFIALDGVGIGPTATKVGNDKAIGPDYFTPDTFNPAAKRAGMTFSFTLTGTLNLSAGQALFFDFAAPGVTSDTAWKAYFPAYLKDLFGDNNGAPPIVHLDAQPLQSQVLRVSMLVGGGSYAVQSGKIVKAVQL